MAVVQEDKLLGGQMSFTKKRSMKLAEEHAKKYLTVASRISLCPLSISAKESLLLISGASKFQFGLELGSCSSDTESKLRSAVAGVLWQKRKSRCLDVLFTLALRVIGLILTK